MKCSKCFQLLCNNSDRTWFFNALTFARSLARCWKPWPSASVFNTSHGTWRMLKHEKPCLILILTFYFSIFNIYMAKSTLNYSLTDTHSRWQGKYSITSMARTRMAHLPWMIRTFFSPYKNSSNSSRKQIFNDFFLILSWNCMLCVLSRIASSHTIIVQKLEKNH